jgi:flavin reductase (DIM6/NTAB) family NADH-FMN oxidoreductase RutF
MAVPEPARRAMSAERGFHAVNLANFSHDERYKFLTAAVVPRPIALVTTLGDGVLNAAPFSSFVILSVDPALLGIVVALEDGTLECKDTHRNIVASREFVINTVSEPMAKQVQECGKRYPASVSEAKEVGFRTLASRLVAPARIADSPLQFECRLHQSLEFGDLRSTLFVGEVLLAHYAEGVAEGHRINHDRLNPLGRIAGRRYLRTRDIFDV